MKKLILIVALATSLPAYAYDEYAYQLQVQRGLDAMRELRDEQRYEEELRRERLAEMRRQAEVDRQDMGYHPIYYPQFNFGGE